MTSNISIVWRICACSSGDGVCSSTTSLEKLETCLNNCGFENEKWAKCESDLALAPPRFLEIALASKDFGVDAVASRRRPVFGGSELGFQPDSADHVPARSFLFALIGHVGCYNFYN